MVTPLHQVCAEVGPDKPRASRDQDAVPLDPRLCLDFGLAVCAQGGLGVAGMDLQNAETANLASASFLAPTMKRAVY